MSIFCLLFLFFFTPSLPAQTLTPSTQTLPGLWSGSLTWGDYDADGDPDLLVSGLTGPAENCVPITRIYRNNSGTLTDINADLPGIYLGKAAWADYDGDGDLDLALSGLTREGAGILKLYTNNAGIFSEDLSQTEFISVRYSALAWADYDNDGDLDLLVSGMTAAGNPSTILYQNGRIDRTRIGSPLGGRPLFSVDGPNSARLINLNQGNLAWGDIDGDGDPDLALSGFGTGGTRQAVIYLNQPNGTLVRDDRNGDLTPISGGDLAWGDYDNDGDLDLALSGWSNEWEATLQVYTNAAGILRENTTFSSTRILGTLAWADYDNDGDLDLAASGQNSLSQRFAFVLRNQPTGTLLEDQSLTLTGLRGGDLAWADLENDGQLDLLISGEDESGTRRTQLYIGAGAPASNTPPNPPNRLSTPVITGSGITLSWNDGSDAQSPSSVLTYTLRIGTSPGGHDVFSGAVTVGPGNVGGSKIVQLAVPMARDTYYWSVQAIDGGFRISSSSQEETFRVQDLVSSRQSLRPLQNSALAWGDYDNDGDLDLAITGRDVDGTARALLYRNDAGTLTENSTVGLQGVQDGDLAWVDFDNDNDLDLSITGADASGNRNTHIYRNRLESNDFALTVQNLQILPQLANSSLSWGDVDNDGDLDLVLMGAGANERITKIFLNQNGELVEDTAQNLTGMDNGDLAWRDYDNDGDLDLVTIGQIDNQNNASLILYRNEPLGTFTPDTRSSLPGLLASALALGDFDNDGDADLAICGFNFTLGLVTKLYVNNGAGVFTDSNVSLTPVAAGDLAWGDFDNDGDFDLALAGQAASGRILEIYRNQSGTFEQVSMDVLVGVDFAAITWADYDNDGDLDLISSGRASPTATSFLPASRVNDNLESRFNPKRRPSPPTALVATTQGSEVFLVWNPSTNVSTPGEALTYAVRVGTEPGGSQIRSGAAPLRNGRIQHNNYFLTGLKSGRYFWAARAIDKALLSSLWSEEQSFIVDIDKPVVDSISVRPRTFGASANRATVVIAFRDEPAGMDNAVSPQVSLHLAGDGPQLSVRQLSFSGNLWIGEADISDPTPSGTAIVRVEAARDLNGNQMDPFEQVIAALVLPGAGGVIESNDGLVRLTIFPSAQSAGLPENPSIEIRSRGVDAPPNGAVPVGLAYEVISTPAFTPSKDATLAFTYPAAGTDPALLAVYRLEGTIWTRLGGTVDVAANQVRIPVGQLGTFALFQDNSATSGQASVTNIGFSNRAFSPGRSGRGPARLASPLYGSTDISFTLGATSTVRIEIYNRSGRLQRVLETGRQMGPGQQVITWDGQNQDGNIVRSGLYIVVIEADGKKAHSTLAVVNN